MTTRSRRNPFSSISDYAFLSDYENTCLISWPGRGNGGACPTRTPPAHSADSWTDRWPLPARPYGVKYVQRSALALKGPTYPPTGALPTVSTTSLPAAHAAEELGSPPRVGCAGTLIDYDKQAGNHDAAGPTEARVHCAWPADHTGTYRPGAPHECLRRRNEDRSEEDGRVSRPCCHATVRAGPYPRAGLPRDQQSRGAG